MCILAKKLKIITQTLFLAKLEVKEAIFTLYNDYNDSIIYCDYLLNAIRGTYMN